MMRFCVSHKKVWRWFSGIRITVCLCILVVVYFFLSRIPSVDVALPVTMIVQSFDPIHKSKVSKTVQNEQIVQSVYTKHISLPTYPIGPRSCPAETALGLTLPSNMETIVLSANAQRFACGLVPVIRTMRSQHLWSGNKKVFCFSVV